MLLKQLLSYLLVLTLFYLPDTGAQIVVRAFKGESVHLPCLSLPNTVYTKSIEWRKNALNSKICDYVIDYVNRTSNGKCVSRFTLTEETFILRIENVQNSDFGNYTCKNTIIIPPPSVEMITIVTLYIDDLSVRRLNSSNVSCIHLICTLEALNPKQVNFTWIRKGQRLPDLSSASNTSSELYLCKPDWDDKDTITCQASYIYNHTTMLYNRSIELNPNTGPASKNKWLLIIACSASAGIIFSLIFSALLCKWRRKQTANGSIVFSNKVYENFSFAMSHRSAETAQSTVKQRGEECIYEN